MPAGSAMQYALANFYYLPRRMQVHPGNAWGSVEKMYAGEFAEIREAWTEVKAAFDEAEALNAGEQPAIAVFGAAAAPVATAR
jgi:hypothetical protein